MPFWRKPRKVIREGTGQVWAALRAFPASLCNWLRTQGVHHTSHSHSFLDLAMTVGYCCCLAGTSGHRHPCVVIFAGIALSRGHGRALRN